jgi:hypothetical protein
MSAQAGSPAEAGGSLSAEDDAPFRSAAISAKVMQHHLWHGDLLGDADGFASFRAWLEQRLPRVTQTEEGYFTAALVRPSTAPRRGPRAVRTARRLTRTARRRR